MEKGVQRRELKFEKREYNKIQGRMSKQRGENIKRLIKGLKGECEAYKTSVDELDA